MNTHLLGIFSIAILSAGLLPTELSAEDNMTFCNPLNLDYGAGGLGSPETYREAADPVIVLFKDKYYLFATRDRGGYRMSDDLVSWTDIPFCDDAINTTAFTLRQHYVAPAVAADDNYIYFINFNTKESPADIIRSDSPGTGRWEKCGEVRVTADPHLFIDNGRYFIYHGLGDAAKCFELDPVTMTEIKGSEVLIRPAIKDLTVCPGYNFGQNEIQRQLEIGDLKYKVTKTPCPEGSWVIKNGDKYYFQFATPGTASQWYCDAVMTSDSPTGPFTLEPYNPISLNVGDFAGGAGHSCVFRDKYGNVWQASTMWVGKRTGFERRIGLFPVKFDDRGRMNVYTRFGEYPQIIPQHRFDPDKQYLAGWNLLSNGKSCTASGSIDGHTPEMAADECIRTWWSAPTGNEGEWFQMDLGAVKRINAIQVNFTEQDAIASDNLDEDYNAYRLYTSKDGKKWKLTADRSVNRNGAPHDYMQLKKPVKARYIKIENVHMPKQGKFALSDLRVFGHGGGKAPVAVSGVKAVRDNTDDRYSTVTWDASKDADGYVVTFGYRPDYLNQSIMIKDPSKTSLDIHILTPGEKYYYRVDAYNENGVTEGRDIVADL